MVKKIIDFLSEIFYSLLLTFVIFLFLCIGVFDVLSVTSISYNMESLALIVCCLIVASFYLFPILYILRIEEAF